MKVWRHTGMALFMMLTCVVEGRVATAAAVEIPILVPQKIAPNVYMVQGEAGVASQENRGFNSNAGFVLTGAGVVVIDALGTPLLGQALLNAIRKITDEPVRTVIVTHYHADHFYGLLAFKQAGAQIWAHKDARAYLRGGEGAIRLAQRRQDLAPWIDEKTQLVAADKWLDDDVSFKMGTMQFDVVHMGPAHSPEDVIIIIGNSGVIFTGDILFSERIPFVGNADSKRWLQSISKLLDLRPTILVAGHGHPSPNPAADLTLTRDYLIYLRDKMGRAVTEFVSFEEVYSRTDWSHFSKLPAFAAANRTNAYGTYLLMEQELLANK